jgi:hypothetical protein
MRRLFYALLVVGFVAGTLLSVGCTTKTIRDTPEEGEEGPEDPRPEPAPLPGK